MRSILRLVSLALLCCLMARPALAVPAPMSKSELLSKSDLVALVRVLGVTCTGVTKDARTGEDLPSYSATAELIEVIKGDEMKGGEVDITFHAIPKGILGPWTVYYYPGRDGVDASRRQRRHLHHDVVERARQCHREGRHHRAADRTRRDGLAAADAPRASGRAFDR